MLTIPTAEELIETTAIEMGASREMSGFALKVAANGLGIATRELKARDALASAAKQRLEALLGEKGDYEALNALLCERIASGAIALDDPALLDHLWATTLDVLAVDQPRYATFKAASDALR